MKTKKYSAFFNTTILVRLQDPHSYLNALPDMSFTLSVQILSAPLGVNLLTLEIMDDSTDFSKTMVRKIVTYIAEHKEELLEKWVEYHEED